MNINIFNPLNHVNHFSPPKFHYYYTNIYTLNGGLRFPLKHIVSDHQRQINTLLVLLFFLAVWENAQWKFHQILLLLLLLPFIIVNKFVIIFVKRRKNLSICYCILSKIQWTWQKSSNTIFSHFNSAPFGILLEINHECTMHSIFMYITQ